MPTLLVVIFALDGVLGAITLLLLVGPPIWQAAQTLWVIVMPESVTHIRRISSAEATAAMKRVFAASSPTIHQMPDFFEE